METESEKHFLKNETVRMYHKHAFVRAEDKANT